jgi:ankyrin repeat protein
MTPLSRSIHNKQIDIVKLLVEYSDTDLSWINKEGNDYLEASVHTNSYDIIKLLLSKHDKQPFSSITQCFFNCVSDMMVKNDVLKLFLNYVDINKKDGCGRTALLQACKVYQRDKIKLLLDHGADIDVTDDSNNTVLMLLIEQCDSSYKDILSKVDPIKLNEYINKKNISGESPLLLAIKIYNLEAINDLVELGANIDDQDMDGKSCLIETILKDNKNAFNLLLSKDVDINKPDNDGLNPIMHAVRMITLDDDYTFIDNQFSKNYDYYLHTLLADSRLDINHKNNFGHTLLNLLILTKLGIHKFESNKKPNDISLGGLASFPECFKTELAGSEPKKVDINKLKGWFNSVINALVVRDDVDINTCDNFSTTPFYLAIEHKDLDLFNILIKCVKLDINGTLPNQNGLTYGMFVYHKLSGNNNLDFLSGSSSTSLSTYPYCRMNSMPLINPPTIPLGGSSSSNINKKVNYDHDYSKYYYMLKTMVTHPNYDLDDIDYDGNTLLTNICKGTCGSSYTLLNDLLITAHAHNDGANQFNLNAQNNDGYTPFMYAVENKLWPVVELLLKGGCDTDLKNKAGKTAKDLADGNLYFEKLVKKYKDIKGGSGWF